MKKPEMIIFDYGHTLLYEPGHNPSNGNRAIYEYIKKNPSNISFEEFDKTIMGLFAKIKAESGPLVEMHEHNFLKFAYEYMDIEMSVSIEDAEKIIWNGISKGAIMPGTEKMLDYLNQKGIRTGVISNLCFSGDALKERLNRFLPNNKFEFVLASSEYIFKKPHSTMFNIAMKKANLEADRIWYCGDSIEADINGAGNVGMFPVFYEGETVDDVGPSVEQNKSMNINYEHLHITDWSQLIAKLEEMK